MERRKFLSWVGLGMLATNLPIILAACSPSNDSVASNEPTEDTVNTEQPSQESVPEFVEVGTEKELKEKGFILNKDANVMVVSNSDGMPIAVSSKCTHQGCTIDWDKKDSEFVCYCHTSIYAVDGSNISGPAPSPLPTYEVKQENGNISVKV